MLRWLARQTGMSLVIVLGAIIGWSARKASGPSLVSEQVGPRPLTAASVPAAGRGPGDAAAHGWLAEARALSSPSASLGALQRRIDAGQISDFGRVARDLLGHPLAHFRREALLMVLPAWGREDPEKALRFHLDYAEDLAWIGGFGTGKPDSVFAEQARVAARSWAQREPLEAIRFLPPEGNLFHSGQDWEDGLIRGLASPGELGAPGLAERLSLMAALHGERSALLLYQNVDWERWGNQMPAAEEWKRLAEATADPALKQDYQLRALTLWSQEGQGEAPSRLEGLAWLGQELSGEARAALIADRPPSEMAEFLRSPMAESVTGETWNFVFASLLGKDPTAAQALLQDPEAAARIDAESFGTALIRAGDASVASLLPLLPTLEQRQEAVRRILLPHSFPRTPADLTETVTRALAFGEAGEATAAAILTERTRSMNVVQQVPEVFSSLPPEVQQRTRLEVVLGLGDRAPDVAAELWMDATPAELVEPGAAVVAEELATRLLRRNPEVGSSWIQQLPPGESRDRAVVRMIEITAAKDPDTCREWAATLGDPAAQSRAAAALAKTNQSPEPR